MRRTMHVHKYKKQILGTKGYTVYKCVLPGCAHYIEKSLVEGKLSICHRCGEVMVMDKYAMTLARPHHPECTISKKKIIINVENKDVRVEDISDKLKNLLNKMEGLK